MAENRSPAEFVKAAQTLIGRRAFFLLAGLALLWAIEFADFLMFFLSFDSLGIRPRSLFGLVGIPLAPLLHGSFSHIGANTFPLLILGGLTLATGTRRFGIATLFIVLASGAGIWLFGQAGTVHVGASGLIFGYLGFLLTHGYFTGKSLWILISILVGLIYGSLIWGLLPNEPGVSWEAHVFGFIGGVFGAWFLGRKQKLT